jgi:hypothetical protein
MTDLLGAAADGDRSTIKRVNPAKSLCSPAAEL